MIENDSKSKVKRNEKGQLQPGSVLNPEGKVPGSLSITALIKAELENVPELKNKEGIDLNPAKKKWVRLFLDRLLQQAIGQGDRATQKLIWNYIDGLPRGSFDVTSMGEKIDGVVILPAKNEDK